MNTQNFTINSTTQNAKTTKSPTKICIVGGGPVALVTALSLLEYGRKSDIKYQLYIFEKRWIVDVDENSSRVIRWKTEGDGNQRRRQVVTVQGDVWTTLLPSRVQNALFSQTSTVDSCEMWPGRQGLFPRNIPIRNVEDVLLSEIQREITEFGSYIELAPSIFEESDLARIAPDAVVLADGGRRYTEEALYTDPNTGHSVFGQEHHFPEDNSGEKLIESVLGMYVENADPSKTAIGVSEADGMALTVSQNRFLLNPLGQKRGFLNMWLTADEGREMSQITEEVAAGGRTQGAELNKLFRAALTDPAGGMFGGSPLLERIRSGLRLYGIEYENVQAYTHFNLGPYKQRGNFVATIPARTTEKGKRILRHALFTVGDAAFPINFRAGRGLNTGIKGAVSVARTLSTWALNIQKASDRGKAMREEHFLEHNVYMLGMQQREVQIRSLGMMQVRDPLSGQTETVITRMQNALDKPGSSSTRNIMPTKRKSLCFRLAMQFLARVETNAKQMFSKGRLPEHIAVPNIDVLREQIMLLDNETLRVFVEGGMWNTNGTTAPDPQMVPEPLSTSRTKLPRDPSILAVFDSSVMDSTGCHRKTFTPSINAIPEAEPKGKKLPRKLRSYIPPKTVSKMLLSEPSGIHIQAIPHHGTNNKLQGPPVLEEKPTIPVRMTRNERTPTGRKLSRSPPPSRWLVRTVST